MTERGCLTIVSALAVVAGFSGITLTVTMEYTEITKHQAGRVITVKGWQPRDFDLEMF